MREEMFYRIYQDKFSIGYNSYVDDKAGLDASLKAWEEYHEEGGFPVIEPVMMTQEEFDNLPEFKGY